MRLVTQTTTLAVAKTAVRKNLTTLLWYEDRLCSLSSTYLFFLSFFCLAVMGALAVGMREFLDDLTFLMTDSEGARAASLLLGLLLLWSSALWVLSCCLGALGRKWLLYIRGL